MEIQKGEALLISSDKSFDERVEHVLHTFSQDSDIVVLKNKSISIEDVRGFQEEFQKSSSETHLEFDRLGILVFDDMSISAQNSLLKTFEDINPKNCIILYTNKNVRLLSTILSRVIQVEENSEHKKAKKVELPNMEDKKNPIDKQQVIAWIEYKIATSKVNKDKQPLLWINSPSPNVKYIVEYVNLFY
jgi:DNA polymerase III delta prime subunit